MQQNLVKCQWPLVSRAKSMQSEAVVIFHALEKSSKKLLFFMQFNTKIFQFCFSPFLIIFFIFHSLPANWNSTAKKAFKSCIFMWKCSHTFPLVSHWL